VPAYTAGGDPPDLVVVHPLRLLMVVVVVV
jgi:hypothetical protein